jgi:hypothetical protein
MQMGCTYPPTHGNQPSPACRNISEVGVPVPVTGARAPVSVWGWCACVPGRVLGRDLTAWLARMGAGPDATKACPAWRSGIPNLKSSGVLSLDGVLYWAVSCFNCEG